MTSGHPTPGKLHPLRKPTIDVLYQIGHRPVECHIVNAGISDRLLREGLIEQATEWVRNKPRPVWRITDAGRARIAAMNERIAP